MLIRQRMTANPVTISPRDTLATAQKKMTAGNFRHLPVIQDSTLIGILTDRDVRRHTGAEKKTRVEAACSEHPLTISPVATVEEATQLMLRHQISGLPVLEDRQLVGIITTSDVMRAFLVGASVSPEAIRLINELCLPGPKE